MSVALKDITAIRKVLTRTKIEKLVHAFVNLRHFSVCVSPIQGVKNVAGGQVNYWYIKCHHVTPVFKDLLPVSDRVNYKNLSIVYEALNILALYLPTIFITWLFSASNPLVPLARLVTTCSCPIKRTYAGDRAFFGAAPSMWNSQLIYGIHIIYHLLSLSWNRTWFFCVKRRRTYPVLTVRY